MGQPVPDSKMPAIVAFVMIIAGCVIAAVGGGGFLAGSILGGVIAGAGAIPACYGMWKGIQQETQGTLAISVLAVLASLGGAIVLIALRLFHWVV
jgi:hypothetical protein